MNPRTDPFEDIERLIDRLGRQLDTATRTLEPSAGEGEEAGGFAPVDLVEYDDEFVATVDLPGFDRDDVSVSVTDHELRIVAERETTSKTEEENERVIRRERKRESVRRSVTLPDEVDTENVSAKMKNGVLTVMLPRKEVESAKEIDIE